MEVLKFGGSSVSSEVSLKNMLKIVNNYDLENEPLIIVVSALKGVTNELVALTKLLKDGDQEYAKVIRTIFEKHKEFINIIFKEEQSELLKKIKLVENDLLESVSNIIKNGVTSDKDYDKVLSFGELFSAQIITAFLNKNRLNFCFKDSRDLIITNNVHMKAKVNWDLTRTVVNSFFSGNKNSYVVSGFIARSIYGDTTTLGRGGSDYTATVLGAILNAEKVTKWTDVNGIMTADPNKVLEASSLENITFSELKNLSKFGSNVLVHPNSIDELSKHNIPFLIRNTFDRDFKGTQVINENSSNKKALSLHESCCLVGFNNTAKVPKEFIKQIIEKDWLFFRVKRPQSKDKSYYVVSEECVNFFKSNIKANNNDVDILNEEMVLITITGENMDKKKEVNKIQEKLKSNDINLIEFRRFYNSISLILDNKDLKKAVVLLHEVIKNDEILFV
ncbi:aspartate kinase [Tenacibaculum sp. MAR_2009_124]|uniref:aspartate kinase n=1 Tax=Tenacibaculum sp. MAR_2009_124 TaxID=1250059 RepID=UPI000896D56A|nr:aspartate kinase [Tenacibaculum sp. MAR_2009_124]SEB35129.1 aspartate kinase [Tenacibaculum sp. MAR_2009_124]